jgi:hypothetical protein
VSTKPHIVQEPARGDATYFRIFYPYTAFQRRYVVTGCMVAATGKSALRLLSEGKAVRVGTNH